MISCDGTNFEPLFCSLTCYIFEDKACRTTVALMMLFLIGCLVIPQRGFKRFRALFFGSSQCLSYLCYHRRAIGFAPDRRDNANIRTSQINKLPKRLRTSCSKSATVRKPRDLPSTSSNTIGLCVLSETSAAALTFSSDGGLILSSWLTDRTS